ncbi:hypothetical protein Tco_1279590 [Tanacetum coccineum]
MSFEDVVLSNSNALVNFPCATDPWSEDARDGISSTTKDLSVSDGFSVATSLVNCRYWNSGYETLECYRGTILHGKRNKCLKKLKHHKDDLSLKDLGKHFLNEEQYRLENKANDDTSKVHTVEEKGESFKAGGKKRSGDPTVLEGYMDASWITDQEDYASMSGWIFTLGGGAVSWGSKKQSCLTDSTMVAECVALASCCKEAKWLRNLLINIPLWPKPMPPISVHCDSQSTLSRM